ncbi:MAG: hypothetical protein JWL59_1935 [Chthoniobacteraceae bacterium]|nr:hypothetical protein [Chthoniobacteraceae bacterium]
MLIQKIFHVCQSLDETQKRLVEIGHHLGSLDGVKLCAEENQPTHLELAAGNGFHAHVHLEQLPCEDADQILFRSVDGDIEVTGLLELFAIRADLTEVQLTLDYALGESGQGLLDVATTSFDRFVNRQLRTVKAWLATGVVELRAPRERRLRSRMGANRQWQFAH